VIEMADEEIKAEGAQEEVKAQPVEVKAKDESKEFVDGVMAELGLKGGSKKRLVKMLGKQYDYDKHKVLWTLKRALITERYAAAVEAEGGH
jgi:hypothetical protein